MKVEELLPREESETEHAKKGKKPAKKEETAA